MEEEALILYSRQHIAVIGTMTELHDLLDRYGIELSERLIKGLGETKLPRIFNNEQTTYKDDATGIFAIDFNARKMFLGLTTEAKYEEMREVIINYSRYGRALYLSNASDKQTLETIFAIKYAWKYELLNSSILHENLQRWIGLMAHGCQFGQESVDAMLDFCEMNELYDEASKIARYTLENPV